MARKLADAKQNSRKLWTAQYEMQRKSCKMNELIPRSSWFAPVGPKKDPSESCNCWRNLKKRKKMMLPMILMMMIFMILLIYFLRRIMKKITTCAQAVMRNLLPILFNHADIFTNCVQKNNCQLCGCRISNNVTIHFEEVEGYFHVFQCFNLDGALASLFFNLFHFVNFCNILTILCSMLFNESIGLDKFQELVDFGPSFCFSWKIRCPIVENFIH